MKRLIFVFLLSCISMFVHGQEKTTYNSDSSLIITRDPRLDQLIEKQREQNLSNQSMHGYRIQVYFGGNRQKASDVKLEFSSKYPDVQSYLTYQQPNFKVRVGDYRNRFEAQKFLKQIEGGFPSSFIVPDEVRLPPLK
jgi:hypothetical protein